MALQLWLWFFCLLMLSPWGRRNLLEAMDGLSLENASGEGNIPAGSAPSINMELPAQGEGVGKWDSFPSAEQAGDLGHPIHAWIADPSSSYGIET